MKTAKGCLNHILLSEEEPSKEELLARFGDKKAEPFEKGEEPSKKDESKKEETKE